MIVFGKPDDQTMYLTGGIALIDGELTHVDTIYTYRHADLSWKEIGRLTCPRAFHGSFFLGDVVRFITVIHKNTNPLIWHRYKTFFEFKKITFS